MTDPPRDLGDGLALRRATADDADELAAFNVRMHSDDPEHPEEWLGAWTRDLLGGGHPTTGPDDVTVVTDAEGRIVSSVALISQTWEYDGVPFGVGQPELVGTDEAWRRRGLCDVQMEVAHARSAERGQVVQAITGIPWLYRRYGYEMALDLRGPMRFFFAHPANRMKTVEETLRLRAATEADVPALLDLYERHGAGSLVTRVRDEAQLRWELFGARDGSWMRKRVRIVEAADGEVAGYADVRDHASAWLVRELAVAAGRSLREVCLFLARALKAEADELNPGREKPIELVAFGLGEGHPACEALGPQLSPGPLPYAWYVRVPDVPGFVERIAPVLERRLAESVMAGHTGRLRIEMYTSRFAIEFERGRITGVGGYEPERFADGDALFPDLTFLKLLFGHRDLEELNHAHADCYAKTPEAQVLLGGLFPKRPSRIVPMG